MTLAPTSNSLPRPARRLRLEHRIRRRYQTVTQSVQLGHAQFPFTRIADPNRVLDDVCADVDRREKSTGQRVPDPPMPYWAELWDSASALAAVVPTLSLSSDSRVLDLGCGMGLSGAAAAAAGAQVLFADLETSALLFAELNSLPFTNRIRTRRLDWRTDRLAEHFDVILGADILYEKAQWPFLNDFWKSHLAPTGQILLGEPGRQTGELFVPWIQQNGWNLHETAQQVPTRQKPIRIFRLTRAEN